MPVNTPTTLACPSCGAPLEVDGKRSLVRCKFCNNIALVPGLPTAPEAAALAIGLGLTLIHLVGIPVTNLSVNPARSTGLAVFVGGWALGQLWLFRVAPIAGALLAGLVYRWFEKEE
jgi:glycerol uptake facilitator-like aquaporin